MTADPVFAYRLFLAAATTARVAVLNSRPHLDPVDVADGDAYLAGLLEGAVQFVGADPAQPAFVPWITPTRRWNDNGFDSVYRMAVVDGAHRYVVRGRRGDETYLAFTLYAGDPGHPERVVRNVNHVELGVAPGEAFEVAFEPPEDACFVIARQYLLDPASHVPASFTIEVTAGPPPRPPDHARLAARWEAATRFLKAMTQPRTPPPAARPPVYVSTTPNVMGDPSAWRAEEGGGRGTPDQIYAMGPFALDPGDALVLEVCFPRCAYAGVALWNRFSQTIDGRFHRSTLNASQVVTGEDGVTRVVVAHRDPGVPNWLDTGGRRRGSVFWRFLLADSPPPPIRSTVVPLDEVVAYRMDRT